MTSTVSRSQWSSRTPDAVRGQHCVPAFDKNGSGNQIYGMRNKIWYGEICNKQHLLYVFQGATAIGIICMQQFKIQWLYIIHLFVANSWSISQAQSKDTRAQGMVGIGVCTQPTLMGAKHCNSAPTATSFTHHNTGVQYRRRNEGILTSNFEVKIYQRKKEKCMR